MSCGVCAIIPRLPSGTAACRHSFPENPEVAPKTLKDQTMERHMITQQLILAKCEHIQKVLVVDSLKLARNFGKRAMTKVVLTSGLLFCLSAAAMAQTNISTARDGNGNLIRRSTPMNNTQPMSNSTINNPPRRVQNGSPTSDDVSRMLGHRK
jgi:hypothetical protein